MFKIKYIPISKPSEVLITIYVHNYLFRTIKVYLGEIIKYSNPCSFFKTSVFVFKPEIHPTIN